LQVRDLDADKTESVCSSEAAGMATHLRDMLNDSGRLNARKGGVGAVACILQMPSVPLLAFLCEGWVRRLIGCLHVCICKQEA